LRFYHTLLKLSRNHPYSAPLDKYLFGETMNRLLCSLLLAVFSSVASAQTAVVTRKVNLRPDASTGQDPIERLTPGARLTFLEPDRTDGYYHVKAPDGQDGFVWGRNVTVQEGDALPTPSPASGGTREALSPLVAKGHPVDWWFAFKFNSASFPKCAAGAVRKCLFGGQVQSSWKSFSQQFAVASSDMKTLQAGSQCAGDTTNDPIGATFDEIYNGTLNYVVWNDQFYQDPKLCGTSNGCRAPWGHSKGIIAWDDAGDGIVMQVTTPDWPGAGSNQHPRTQEGNTLGCTARDNDVLVSQHFFALKLSKDDVVKILTALQNASVVTDIHNAQIVKSGGPADIAASVAKLGVKSARSTFTHDTLSTGVQLISKPSSLHVPPWQMVSSVLDGVSLRAATWWANPGAIPSTTSSSTIDCWDSSLSAPGGVEIATSGHFGGKTFGLKGIPTVDGNHAKIGVSTSGTHHYTIFGDMNQQGAISGKCNSGQNGRGGLFFVIDDAELADSVSALIKGDSAPTGP
jgi:Deoxyribonuclease II